MSIELETIKVVVNSPGLAKVLSVKVGDEVGVKCKKGVPVVKEWRNRFRDMEQDSCISLPQEQKKTSFSKKVTAEENSNAGK